MRVRTFRAVFVLLGGVGVAPAQQQASSFFTGVPAGSVVNKPIDTTKAVVQNPGQSALTSRFNFTGLFKKNTVPAYPTVTGVSALPAPSSFPSTSYPNFRMVGNPPFLLKWMFGSDQNAIQPVKPFTPGTKPPVGPGS